jgi:uncharacterized membrane protein
MLEIINGSSSKMVQTWWNMVSSEAILILANHDSNHDQVTVAAVGMIKQNSRGLTRPYRKCPGLEWESVAKCQLLLFYLGINSIFKKSVVTMSKG